MSRIKVENIRHPDGTDDNISLTDTGRVGIGVASPAQQLHIAGSTGGAVALLQAANDTAASVLQFGDTTSTLGQIRYEHSSDALSFYSNNSEAARFDSSGRLGLGTSSPSQVLDVSANDARFNLTSTGSGQTVGISIKGGSGGGDTYNYIESLDSAGAQKWYIGSNGTANTLAFKTNGNNERMRINSSGRVYIGTTTTNPAVANTAGSNISADGLAEFSRSGAPGLYVNRIANDGTLVQFRQSGTEEGNISVSGTTVSYNGAHLSRWSQLPGGVERTEILRGSVLSNIDEMCEWSEEDNEQLNRMKVSDVEGDRNVSGVFQAWDDDDDTYTDDFYCAMTGDFVIRIAQGVTVERGDLLMSAGDGTAKPQDDDIIRSKTIAKVTSTNVSCTYDDGSYCVPCVLMAC